MTLVLVIAAGIHFITPPARELPEQQSTLARPSERAEAVLPRVADSPAIDLGAIELPQTSAPSVPRVVRPRRPDRPPQRAIDEGSSARRAAAPRPMAPVVGAAAFAIPEESLRLESMLLSVSEEFVEAPLPALSNAVADGDEASVRGARRDPVTAVFVTAGRSVAGGFRSAGRAVKRVF